MTAITLGWLLWTLGGVSAVSGTDGQAVSPRVERRIEAGMAIYTLEYGDLAARVVPDAGANMVSLRWRDREYLRVPPPEHTKGFMYGVPILYPTPNRVRDAKFTYNGREFSFQANNGANFIHGLVHDKAFTARVLPSMSDNGKSAALECLLHFAPGTPMFERFPLEHTLRVVISVQPNKARWDYSVVVPDKKQTVPFGFGLHPWFLYQGERARTFLTVPAEALMESSALLPTGKLLPLEGHRFDMRQPRSLADLVTDDVFFGMRPDRPALLDFRGNGLQVQLAASDDFTHMVVYTPANADYFCVENQTCSTDAHNLHAQGKTREAHLLEVAPGQTRSGWIEYRFLTP